MERKEVVLPASSLGGLSFIVQLLEGLGRDPEVPGEDKGLVEQENRQDSALLPPAPGCGHPAAQEYGRDSPPSLPVNDVVVLRGSERQVARSAGDLNTNTPNTSQFFTFLGKCETHFIKRKRKRFLSSWSSHLHERNTLESPAALVRVPVEEQALVPVGLVQQLRPLLHPELDHSEQGSLGLREREREGESDLGETRQLGVSSEGGDFMFSGRSESAYPDSQLREGSPDLRPLSFSRRLPHCVVQERVVPLGELRVRVQE